jgi:hypothetical protein
MQFPILHKWNHHIWKQLIFATARGSIEGHINSNALFGVSAFHPIHGIVYFDVRTVAV